GAGGLLTPAAVAGRVAAHSDVRSRGTGPGHDIPTVGPLAPDARQRKEDDAMRSLTAALLLLLLSFAAITPAVAAERQLTWAIHISLAPTWFDPAETPGIVTPFMILYALHDAVAKPMPGKAVAPCLAESWTVSPDGLTYDFTLRSGVKFHNGETM